MIFFEGAALAETVMYFRSQNNNPKPIAYLIVVQIYFDQQAVLF